MRGCINLLCLALISWDHNCDCAEKLIDIHPQCMLLIVILQLDTGIGRILFRSISASPAYALAATNFHELTQIQVAYQSDGHYF
jgi:hypothetical protein